MGRGQLARRAEPEGFQSPGAGRGNLALARGRRARQQASRECREGRARDTRRGAQKEAVTIHWPPQLVVPAPEPGPIRRAVSFLAMWPRPFFTITARGWVPAFAGTTKNSAGSHAMISRFNFQT